MEKELTCKYCKETGYLVLSKINADYSCEACGEWQDLTLNSAYYPVETASNFLAERIDL